jgi:hypothetical protein
MVGYHWPVGQLYTFHPYVLTILNNNIMFYNYQYSQLTQFKIVHSKITLQVLGTSEMTTTLTLR